MHRRARAQKHVSWGRYAHVRNLAAKAAGFLQDLKFEMIRLVGKEEN